MYYLGVDLGQRKDHTALAILQRWEASNGYDPPVTRHLEVQYLERVPLGTPYTLIADRIRRLVQDPQLAGRVAVAIDATGVGAPVVDLLRAARLGCDVTAVSITGGDRESHSGRTHNVPKRDLIAGVQLLLEHGQLRIARRLPAAFQLVKELVDVRATPTANPARPRLGADGGGEHDDLVIAVSLACWRATRGTIGHRGVRLPGI